MLDHIDKKHICYSCCAWSFTLYFNVLHDANGPKPNRSKVKLVHATCCECPPCLAIMDVWSWMRSQRSSTWHARSLAAPLQDWAAHWISLWWEKHCVSGGRSFCCRRQIIWMLCLSNFHSWCLQPSELIGSFHSKLEVHTLLSYQKVFNTFMGHMTIFWSMMDHIYNDGPTR